MLNIDKSNWKKVSLSDVVVKTENNDKLNAKNLFKKFIKAEHLDAESLNIKNFGDQDKDELPLTFYKIFKANQILYPTRNPHLRRAALAHFDGICGEKTLTLSVNEDVADYRFIAFLFHSNTFYTHTTNCIVGSTNPHVRWRDVANYKFLLPPKEQQAELAELLWAMDTVVEKDLEVLERLEDDIQNIFLSKIIHFNIEGLTITGILDNLNKHLGLGLLKDFGTFLKGKGIPKDDVIESGIPCIRYGEIYTSHHIVIRKFRSFISEEVASTSFQLNKGDIVFAGSGETITEIGKSVCFVDDFEAYAGGDTIIFRPDSKKINSVYLSYLLNSLISRLQLNKMGTGATVAHIYPEDLKKIRIPVLDISKQNEIAVEMETIFKSIDQLKSKLQSSKALQRALINQIF